MLDILVWERENEFGELDVMNLDNLSIQIAFGIIVKKRGRVKKAKSKP